MARLTDYTDTLIYVKSSSKQHQYGVEHE